MSRPGYVDARGSTRNRRARREWLLSPESGFGGDGEKVPCAHCGAVLTRDTLEVDRHPTCGHDGGRYVRRNIVPSCRDCNVRKPCCLKANRRRPLAE